MTHIIKDKKWQLKKQKQKKPRTASLKDRMEDKFIDVEKVIASKSEQLAKRLPKFIIRYLKKTLHQDEINQLLHENAEVYDYDFCRDVIKRWNITVKVKGMENVA